MFVNNDNLFFTLKTLLGLPDNVVSLQLNMGVDTITSVKIEYFPKIDNVSDRAIRKYKLIPIDEK